MSDTNLTLVDSGDPIEFEKKDDGYLRIAIYSTEYASVTLHRSQVEELIKWLSEH